MGTEKQIPSMVTSYSCASWDGLATPLALTFHVNKTGVRTAPTSFTSCDEDYYRVPLGGSTREAAQPPSGAAGGPGSCRQAEGRMALE